MLQKGGSWIGRPTLARRAKVLRQAAAHKITPYEPKPMKKLFLAVPVYRAICPLGNFVLKGKLMETDNKQHESRTGRPTLKTPELCTLICERVAKGETLTSICNEPEMPAWTTVHDWKKADESFRQDFMRAREQQAEIWADELVDISDAELPTHEAIGRARLRMQSRQWLAGKYNPQFADKPTQVGVQVGVQVVLSEAERQKLIERRDRALLANQGKGGAPA
jgi:hypothetical protein